MNFEALLGSRDTFVQLTRGRQVQDGCRHRVCRPTSFLCLSPPLPTLIILTVLCLLSICGLLGLVTSFCRRLSRSASFYLQLSAMNVSARTTMKGTANCDKHCELQNSVNRQELERILCFRDIPDSMPASVCMFFLFQRLLLLGACCCDRLRVKICQICNLEASDVQGLTSVVTCLSVVCVARCFIDVSHLL